MKINNHYVPQTYLKQWANDAAKKKIWEYKLLVPHQNCCMWVNTSMAKTASFKNLYTYYPNHSKEKLTDEMENYFFNNIEKNYNSFINRINSHTPLNKDDQEYISKLVASQYIRTPQGFQLISKTFIDTFPNVIDTVTKLINKNLSKINTLPPINNDLKNNTLIPIKIHSGKLNDKQYIYKIETIIGKSAWLQSLKTLLNKTYKVLNNISWSIYHAPSNFNWVTSDSPVIFLSYYGKNNYIFKGSWGQKNANVIFPLSPTKLLFAEIGTFLPQYQTASYDFAIDIQKMIIENALLKIYAKNKNTEIAAIRNCNVNKDYFNEVNNSLNKFHKNYLEIGSKFENINGI